MKFRCHAVDERGRVVSEVLRAENESDAREMLLEENLFPKRLEPVGEEEKVTWVSRRRVQSALDRQRVGGADASGEEPATHEFRTTLRDDSGVLAGSLGITKDGKVFFTSRKGRREIPAESVELARLRGFPVRVLEIFLIDGSALRIGAGVFPGHVVARTAARKLVERSDP